MTVRFRCRAVLALLFLAAPLEAQEYASLSRQVDSLFARYGPETPGVAIRVIHNGRVVHANEYGMANLEHSVPITASTVFAIGSASKQFTGMAVAMLAKDGRIDLDADVRTYVPEVPDFGETITIRQLLHHQSGIRDWVRPFYFAGFSAADVIEFDHVMEFLRHQKDLNFSPGERYMYSNTGYVLLAEVVQRVTGMSFPEWMREHVFEPLGMANTRVRERYFDFVEHFATSYAPIGDGSYGTVPSNLSAYGSCCVLMPVDDLVKWVQNFETGEVGGLDVVRQMQDDKVEIAEWDRLVGYSYGLMHFDWHGHRGLFHSGQWVGFRAAVLIVPDERFAVVALSNAGPTTNLREWDVLDLYLGNRQAASANLPELRARDFHVGMAVLDRYVGLYNLGLGELVTITRAADQLMGGFTSDPGPYPLAPLSPTEFQFRADGDTMRFESVAGGPATALTWRGKRAPRSEAFDPTAEDLDEYAGIYHSEEIETTLRFEVEEGRLVARQIRWAGGIAFRPLIKDEFRGERLITHARFVRDATGRVSGVQISGRRALRLRFAKLES